MDSDTMLVLGLSVAAVIILAIAGMIGLAVGASWLINLLHPYIEDFNSDNPQRRRNARLKLAGIAFCIWLFLASLTWIAGTIAE